MRLPVKLGLAALALGLLAWAVAWGSGEVKHKVVVATKGVDCADFRFSQAEWNSQPVPERFRNGPRTQQAVGLSECELLLGRNRPSVLKMLGPPQPDFGSPRHRSYRRSGVAGKRLTVEWKYREWDYIVGGDGDSLVLAVKFDRRGRVRRAEIY